MSATSQVIQLLVLLTFATGVGATFYVIGQNTGGNDNASSVNSSLKTVLGINFVLLFFFALFNYYLFKQNNGYSDLYNSALIYLSFFLSFMSMSINLIDKTTA